jgi:hypothetical protein
MNTITRSILAAFAALALTSCAAHAASWRFDLTPYAWATDLGVKADIEDRTIVDETIAVSDLLKQIDTIFQMRFQATYGEFGITTDLFDVTLSDEANGVALPKGAGSGDFSSDMGMTIGDVALLYDPAGDHQGLAVFGGARIINERATVDATFHPAPGGSASGSYETNDTYVDGLMGVRFTKTFARRWSWQMQADASTGGTDYTWSAGPTLGWAFGRMGRYGIQAGYRHMEIDFQDEDGLDAKMTLSGVLLGLRTSF